ncbi:testicular haploid expressed gene protein-like [Empidonax traillii]|uniref:testicular haploid expressed gene protein-like n=1 Tax=Empidonax traillii TaxID=164674 RepID=UPI000FFD4B0E|nr:testicular haploid expressed gene protein-like [Empidonax traillii]
MTARPSSRITLLSKSRIDFCKHQRSYRSVIGGRPPLVKFAYPSERLLKLSEPKKVHPAFLQQRSPEWPVSLSALTYNASPRILALARPKSLHPQFIPPREVPTQVPTAATLANASPRIERLAEPCVRQMTCCYKHSYPESVIRPVSKSAQQAVASPRTIELARPKKLHSKYEAPRNPEWPVSEAAKRAVATPRIVELAQPGKRPPMGLAQFNIDAFRVKETAMKAICSDRIRELARPIQR